MNETATGIAALAIASILAYHSYGYITMQRERDKALRHREENLASISANAISEKTTETATSREQTSKHDELQARVARLEASVRRLVKNRDKDAKQLADSTKQIERLRWDIEAFSAKLRKLESRTQELRGVDSSSQDIAHGASAHVGQPDARQAKQTTEEAFASLFRQFEGNGDGRSDDFVGLGARLSQGRSLIIEKPERIPDELQQVVAYFRRQLGDFPELLSEFEKGLAQGLKMSGRQASDGH